MKTICIHQPEHLVWLGLLDKIKKSDVFVILDDVQYEKNNVQNRNRIRAGTAWTWLTVPIKKHSLYTPINEIEISHDTNWVRSYLSILQTSYQDSKNFASLYPKMEEILNQNFVLLIDLNLALLYFFLKEFGITTKVILASSILLPDSVRGSDRIFSICKKLKAKKYISGPGGNNYLRLSEFIENDIEVEFHTYVPPNNLSAIDYLFNV